MRESRNSLICLSKHIHHKCKAIVSHIQSTRIAAAAIYMKNENQMAEMKRGIMPFDSSSPFDFDCDRARARIYIRTFD